MANAEGFDGPDYGMGEAGWDELFGAVMHSGVLPASSQSMQVYTDQDGAQIKIRAGSSLIRGTRKVWDGITVRAVQPNFSATQGRYDAVVHRKDPASNTLDIVVLQGTTAATPTLPTLTRVPGGIWEEPLAALAVPANFARPGGSGSILTNQITDLRTCAWKIDNPADVYMNAGENLPALGWGWAEGLVLRRDFYPRVYAAVTNRWGTPPSAQTFYGPDYRLRSPRGGAHDPTTGVELAGGTVGILAGSDQGAITAFNQLPNGTPLTSGKTEANYFPASPGGAGNIQMTYVSGGSQPFSILPRVSVCNFMMMLR